MVTTTTHKSLRGPRGAMIFFRKGVRKTDKKGKEIMYDMEQQDQLLRVPRAAGAPPHAASASSLSFAMLKQWLFTCRVLDASCMMQS